MAPRKDNRKRLDVLLVDLGLSESREKAQAAIMAGSVTVDGKKVDKASALIASGAEVSAEAPSQYASRGGYKLAHALDTFPISVRNLVALDAGASTGGFTHVLLQRGATRVYAVDVGYGQLVWSLRNDPRVHVLERTNVRYLHELPEPVDIVTADLSFISLTLVLQPLVRLAAERAHFVVLIKPQFEAGKAEVGRGGVVRDPAVHRRVLQKVTGYAAALGLTVCGLTASPILGPAGNVEFLGWLRRGDGDGVDLEPAITAAIEEAERAREGAS